jgi:pyruvate formate lyase activating enzyme
MIKTAAWWRPLDNGQVACDLCPIYCRLREGQTGPCATRANHKGAMVPLHYGRIVSAAVDPIEKKPLYHYHPGRPILSVAAPGCNLHCQFCQNWNISQEGDARTQKASPIDLAVMAQAEEAVGIAFTYSEPLVWFEFVKDTATVAREKGLKNVLVTNGYLNPEPLAELLPLIDAANIDLKSMDDLFYRKICKARLEPVLSSIRQFKAAGVHLEITNLVIPGHNDREDQIAELVDFVADLDPEIPLHFSAYHPAWNMKAPPTPLDTLLKAREIAAEKLKYVYLGNAQTTEGRDTVCPECETVVIERSGYRSLGKMDHGNRCPGCATSIPVVMD